MRDSDTAKEDFDYARDTLYDLIEKGKNSIEDMIEVARESEHPRAYEVLGKYIKDIADVSDKLAQLHKDHKAINKPDDQKALPGNTTNNLFVGSTTEIQKMLKGEIQNMKDVVQVDDSDEH